jgi:hypothetical protein
MSPETLHYLLTREIVETGHAPGIERAAALAGCNEAETVDALRGLAEIHGVILEPESCRVWSLHPFALMPTAFWVSGARRGWWANCAWCSLGIAAATGEDVAISTFDGGEGEPLRFEIRGGESTRSDLVMHLPYPPARWWDNPYCPCGNILFFSSEARVDGWCARHGRPRGAALKMATAVKLGKLWFGDYASRDWKRKTPAQAQEIFRELGLDEGFWNLGAAFR